MREFFQLVASRKVVVVSQKDVVVCVDVMTTTIFSFQSEDGSCASAPTSQLAPAPNTARQHPLPQNAVTSSASNQSLSLPLMLEEEDNEQSILDQHFNKIGWDQSRGETPTGGTGRHSPEHLHAHANASMMAAGANVSGLLHNSLNMSSTSASLQPHAHAQKASSAYGAHAHKKRANERDVGSHSMVSFDSGVVDDHRHHNSVARMMTSAPNRSFSSHNNYQAPGQRLPPAANALGGAPSQPTGATPNSSVFTSEVVFDDRSKTSTSMRHARRSVDAMTVADSGVTELGPPLSMTTAEPAKQK